MPDSRRVIDVYRGTPIGLRGRGINLTISRVRLGVTVTQLLSVEKHGLSLAPQPRRSLLRSNVLLKCGKAQLDSIRGPQLADAVLLSMSGYDDGESCLALEKSKHQVYALAEFLETMSESWERLEPVLARLHAGIEECRLLMPCLAEQVAACHTQVEAVPESKGAFPKTAAQCARRCRRTRHQCV